MSNPLAQSLFSASVTYHETRIVYGVESAEANAAMDALEIVRAQFSTHGGTRYEADWIVYEGRLQAAVNAASSRVFSG